MPLLINNDVTGRVLEMEDVVAGLESAFTQLGEGQAAYQPRTDILSPTAENADYYCWGSLLGAIRDPPRLAMRFKSDLLRWEEHPDTGTVRETKFNGQPGTFMGFVLLFDTSTGELLAMLNDGRLQHARVGATAGVACKYLSREDAETVGILGSGGMARSYLRAFDAVRDLTAATVYSPTESNREAYAEEMSDELGIDVTPVESDREAMAGVDVAATCTDAIEPVYSHEWLEDGQFVVDVRTQEMTEETFEAADRVVTTNNTIATPYQLGTERERDQLPSFYADRRYHQTDYPTIGEVLSGDEPGRRNDDETIFYHNTSAGIQFAATCDIVYRTARERGLGTELPLGWFQQDIRN